MKSLLSIKDFGNIDANLDDLLDKCFEEHIAFKQLKEFSKFIVIGKKGSGKTAIFRKLLKTSSYNTFCEGYNLTDYPWHHHALQAKVGVPDSEKFIQSWKYLLLISISKLLLNKDQSVPFDGDSLESMKILERFVIDTYGSKNPDITNIFTPNRKLRLTSLLGGKIGTNEVQLQLPFEVVDMNELPTVVQDVNKSLMYHVIKCLNPDNKYFVCFDELDIDFDKKSERYFNQIVGLIRAARDFNIHAHEYSKNINVCIFLRDDIYDLLRFEDKRKITQNYVTRIEWDTSMTNNTLKELMEKRFTELLKQYDNEKISWNDVFDEKIKINGKNSKYNYLTDMTCLRPRDMIDLCNNILIEYKKRSESCNRVENIFENVDITNAKEMYSRNLLEEFDDELHKHIPEYETYLEMIKKVGKSKFSYEEFKIVYDQMKTKLIEVKDSITILENLYTFSVIGNYKIGGNHGGSKNVFKYKDNKEKLRNDLKIIVHPGLVNILGLKGKWNYFVIEMFVIIINNKLIYVDSY